MTSAAVQPSPSDPVAPSIPDLRAAVIPLAHELGRLGSAAHFLTGVRQAAGDSRVDLTAHFERTRDTMRELQSVLQERDAPRAARVIESLTYETRSLHEMLVSVEETVDLAGVEAYLGHLRVPDLDLLRRVTEFYATSCPHDTTRREKMVAVAASLASKKGLGPTTPSRIRQEFERLGMPGIVPPSGDASGGDPRLDRAAALRAEVMSLKDESSKELTSLAQRASIAATDLGEALYTTAGLAEAVALRIAVQERSLALERSQIENLDMLLRDMEGVFEDEGRSAVEDAAPRPRPIDEEDPEAMALIRMAADDLERAMTDGTQENTDLYLDPIEVESAAPDARTSKPASVIVEAVVCRAAIERLARRYARVHLPDDVEPAPVPRPMALTLVRRAVRIERELQDFIERDLAGAHMESAKTRSRCQNRLSRSRLGLAILADIPANGVLKEEAAGGKLPEGPRAEQDENIKRLIEHAYLFREAITDEPAKKPVRVRTVHRIPKPKGKNLLFVTLGAVALAAVVFHLAWWDGSAGNKKPIDVDLACSVPVDAVHPVDGTAVVVASFTWENMVQAMREEHVLELWQEARDKGYRRMVVLNVTGAHPLAVATEETITYYPVGSQQTPGAAPLFPQ